MDKDLLRWVLLREEKREREVVGVGLELERKRVFGVRERKWREQVEEETIDAAVLLV